MLQGLRGFAQFISAERGLMLFMISAGSTFLIGEELSWLQAGYLGVIVFCGWSGVDAMNNVYDADLDKKSDPFRAEYTKKLGTLGLIISLFFLGTAISLGLVTQIPLLTAFIIVDGVVGILYSVPPFRLRQTVLKPLVNFSVGSVPVLIVASFFSVFSAQVWPLVFLIGITTAVNSLWEDLADYASDLHSDARTFLVVLGLRKGFFTTIVLGYCLVPPNVPHRRVVQPQHRLLRRLLAARGVHDPPPRPIPVDTPQQRRRQHRADAEARKNPSQGLRGHGDSANSEHDAE